MKASACNGVCHIRAQLSVRCAGIHVGAARPVAQGVDDGIREEVQDALALCIALADNEIKTVNDVFSVRGEYRIQISCDVRQHVLLDRDGHALEDTIISTAQSVLLIPGEDRILPHLMVIEDDAFSGDALHGLSNVFHGKVDGSLCDHMAHAVSDEHLHGDLRVLFLRVCQIHKRACNTICDLVRVRGVYFFKHLCFPPRISSFQYGTPCLCTLYLLCSIFPQNQSAFRALQRNTPA